MSFLGFYWGIILRVCYVGGVMYGISGAAWFWSCNYFFRVIFRGWKIMVDLFWSWLFLDFNVPFECFYLMNKIHRIICFIWKLRLRFKWVGRWIISDIYLHNKLCYHYSYKICDAIPSKIRQNNYVYFMQKKFLVQYFTLDSKNLTKNLQSSTNSNIHIKLYYSYSSFHINISMVLIIRV